MGGLTAVLGQLLAWEPAASVARSRSRSSDKGTVAVWQLPIAWTALAVATVFLLVSLSLPLFRRSRLPEAGPRTLDVPLQLPPAVAALLVHPEGVPGEAAAATVVDLAARGVLELVDLGGGRCAVRLTGRDPGDLSAAEARVLARVRDSVGADGVVPAAALTAGRTPAAAASWLAGFRGDVLAAARAGGWVRRRYGREVAVVAALGVLVLGAIAVAAFAGATTYNRLRAHPPVPQQGLRVGLMLGTGAVTALALLVLARLASGSAQQLTASGRAQASRLLGLGSHLAADEQIPVTPPQGVAIWGRLLAFATGFGVARSVQVALPLGPESDTLAWTQRGQRWEQVRISYRGGRLDVWGEPPGRLFGAGLRHLASALPLVLLLSQRDTIASALRTFDVPWWGIALAALVLYAFAFSALRGVLGILVALVTLVSPQRTVTGVVLRERTGRDDGGASFSWLALDDGVALRTRSLRVFGSARAGVDQGDTVSLRVRGPGRQVVAVERVPATSAGAPSVAGRPAPTPA